MSVALADTAEAAAPVEGRGLVPHDVALVPKRAYVSEDVLREEVGRLFTGSWLFVGTTAELADNHSFVTLDLPGVAVVVQNFKGELRAFQNVCTHRFNRIQTQERGSRPLQCGYHAWSFDQSGFPVGRPKRDQFPVDTPASRERLCLPRYRVETWGCFVFVDVSGAAPPLADYLGDVGDALKTLGAAIGNEIQYTSYSHACNWKLLVENVLECYHCAAVHPETFIEGLGVGRHSIRDVIVDDGHSSCHFPRNEIKRENLRRKILSHLTGREYAHDSFFHIYVFPNLFVSSTEGVTFYIGQAVPVDARHTVLRTRVFEPRVLLSEGGRARQDLLNAQSVTMVERVIGEDKAILEAVQRGVELSSKPGILGADEVRIAAFFEHYRHRMGDAFPAE